MAQQAKHAVVPGKAIKRRTVKFGNVKVLVQKPSAAELKRNVDRSSVALERAMTRIVQPGIKLARRKDIPLFFIDAKHPETFIRQLNGKRERGVLENGEFKVTG